MIPVVIHLSSFAGTPSVLERSAADMSGFSSLFCLFYVMLLWLSHCTLLSVSQWRRASEWTLYFYLSETALTHFCSHGFFRNWFDWLQRDKKAPPPCHLSSQSHQGLMSRQYRPAGILLMRRTRIWGWSQRRERRSKYFQLLPNLLCPSQSR